MKTFKVPYDKLSGIDIYGDGDDYNNACVSLQSGDFIFRISICWSKKDGVPALLLEMLSEAGINEKNIAALIKQQTEKE